MEIGLFGKLPSHGDFLRRRASDAFVNAWDAWLREGLAASLEALGERWLEVYLTSPAWRFVCAAGTCGPSPVIGLMVPSVDRVGRYFPLTLVASLPPGVDPLAATKSSEVFFARAERVMIDTLAMEEVDFERFDAEIVRLGEALDTIAVPLPVVLDPGAESVLDDGAQLWQVPLGSTRNLTSAFEQLLSQRLSSVFEPLALWWTEGSSVVEPSCLISKGLPHPSTFVALLDGAWAQYRWRPVPARVDTRAPLSLPVEQDAPISFRSAAASDVGLVRDINEDAFVERSEIGMWAVADGLGGHRDGEVASRMVCDTLAELEPAPTFDDTIDAARQRLQWVNDYLLRSSAGGGTLANRSASTVVVLLVRGSSCAILWAGDSRVYRWRSGRLERLTRDHSVEDSDGPGGRETSTAITRAVGVQSALVLDLRGDDVCSGDRFLLCSDGLTRALTDPQIEAWMDSEDIGAAVQGLIATTLAAGAPDNVTVLIVEAYADGDSLSKPDAVE